MVLKITMCSGIRLISRKKEYFPTKFQPIALNMKIVMFITYSLGDKAGNVCTGWNSQVRASKKEHLALEGPREFP